MTVNNFCSRKICVTKVGTSSTNPLTVQLPPVLNIGEFNSANVDQLFQQFENGIVAKPGDRDPINRLISQYGENSFYGAVSSINLYFNRSDVIKLVNPIEYTFLSSRLDTGLIFTPIEIAEFILEFGYTPTGLISSTNVISDKLVVEFEAFYVKNFTANTAGSFCALLPNIFGAVGIFFTALNGASDLIGKLKNFSLDFSLVSLVNQLKENINKVIEKVIQKVKSTIENFSLVDVVNGSIASINQRLFNQYQKIKETAMAFFDTENLQNFKSRISNLIDYALGIFKNPSLEEIQYLLYRFCGFIASVENGINDLKEPLNTFTNSYRETVSILQANSSGNTVRAVNAGGLRYEPNIQNSGINTSREMFEAAGDIAPFTAADYESITLWNGGAGDSRIGFAGRWPSVLGRDGWEKVDPNVRAMLMRVQKDFGKRLIVNSGYRSPSYNSGIPGAAKNSLHMSGLALDISWQGFNQVSSEQFIQLARLKGFRGIGKYNTFIHVDIGRQRVWTG